MRVHALDVRGLRQPVARGSGLDVSPVEEHPGDRVGRDEIGVTGGCGGGHTGTPERARVARVLPCRKESSVGRGAAEEVGDELRAIDVEQGRLRREEREGEARAGRQADVVLGAAGVAYEEHYAPIAHLELVGHVGRLELARVGGLGQRECENPGEGQGSYDGQDATLGPMLGLIVNLHTLLLLRVRRDWATHPSPGSVRVRPRRVRGEGLRRGKEFLSGPRGEGAVRDQTTAASRSWMLPSSASISTRTPMGRVSWRSMCPMSAPLQAGMRSGSSWSLSTRSRVSRAFAAGASQRVHWPKTTPRTRRRMPASS